MKIHLDTLAAMSDYEVENLYRKTHSRISGLRRSTRSLKADKLDRNLGSIKHAEVEYCYVLRELEIRRSRKLAHEEYIFSLKNKK